LGLAETILALHEDIMEVYILQEKDGQHIVVDEAARGGISLLAECMNQTYAPLSSAILIGAAGQIARGKSVKLLGIQYGEEAIILSPLSEAKLVALSTSSQRLSDVMRDISEPLSKLARQQTQPTIDRSAESVEDMVVRFLTSKAHGASHVQVDGVNLRGADQIWVVRGSTRSGWLRRKFNVEFNGHEGTIVKFTSAPMSLYYVLEGAFLIAAACLVAWMLLTRL
jgi:hypothetical protein